MDSRVNRSLQVIRPPTVKPSNIIDYSPLKKPIVPPQPSFKRASTVAAINTLKQIFAARGTLSRSRTTTAPTKTQRPLKGNGIAFTSKARLERVRSDHSLVSRCLQTRRVKAFDLLGSSLDSSRDSLAVSEDSAPRIVNFQCKVHRRGPP